MNEPFHGLLLVNKESGCTSHDVVARTRRILGTRSVGHSGTLDPLAQGLMVLLIGEGTKLSSYILEGDKAYRAQAKLGLLTDTLDITGQVLEEKPVVDCPPERILKIANDLQGDFEWDVPLFSAVKVQGKALHEYARQGQGEEVVRPVKKMKFWGVQARVLGPDLVEIDMECGKGGYVRSWIKEMGMRLGCGATMSALTRTGSVPYTLDQASSLEEIDAAWRAGQLTSAFIPMDQALPRTRKIRVKGPDQSLLMNGQISHDLRSMLISQVRPETEDVIQIISMNNQLLALIGLEKGRGFVIRRVFRYPAAEPKGGNSN